MSKYKIAYRDANPSWQELCPVRMLAIQVSRDTETGACFLQTKIVNVSTKPISRIEFAHMTQSAVKSHNGPADRLQSVGGACR